MQKTTETAVLDPFVALLFELRHFVTCNLPCADMWNSLFSSRWKTIIGKGIDCMVDARDEESAFGIVFNDSGVIGDWFLFLKSGSLESRFASR